MDREEDDLEQKPDFEDKIPPFAFDINKFF